MSASPASKRVHSGTEATNVATLTTRPLQRSAGSLRRGTSNRISSAPRAGRNVTTVSRPTGIIVAGSASPTWVCEAAGRSTPEASLSGSVGGLSETAGASSSGQEVDGEDHGAGEHGQGVI